MELTAKNITRFIAPTDLDFESTQELPDFTYILGQSRATEALQFGIDMKQPGYNLYVAAATGSGRTRYITEYIKPIAAHGSQPKDWLYVNNFDNPSEPRSISLPHGQGQKFRRDIDALLDQLLATFPTVFDNPSYIQQRNSIQKNFDETYESALLSVEQAASVKDIAAFREEGVISFSPIVDDQIADDAYFASMSEEQRKTFRENVLYLENLLHDTLIALPQWQRELNNQLRLLQQKTIQQILKPLLEDLQYQYQGLAGVMLYLAQLKQHLPKTISDHLSTSEHDDKEKQAKQRKLLETEYLPNLISRRTNQQGLPLILESNPSYANLFGRISVPSHNNETRLDFQHLVGGALHQANSGYLIIHIEKILTDKETWKTLKRVLREGSISIDIQASDPTINLKPEAIPLDVKIILIGPSEIYNALRDIDQDFSELFRVLIEFDSDFICNNSNLNQFAGLLHTRAKKAGLAELSADAIASLAEFALRLAEHQNRLSTRIDLIMEVITEAEFWRLHAAETLITQQHIDQAITKRNDRHSHLKDRLKQDILCHQIKILSQGKVHGQVNGLAVIENGDHSFGWPLRVTATAHPGCKGVVDIEREVNLGQSVHSKGVLLLSGYLANRYARSFSLAISAHIAVEQSYGFIDGDSASLAELCALLSAIIQLPLKQELAVTGAVSQFGEVQAVGGVNEKIEGFFAICESRQLTGQQGVIIPASNSKNLMLNKTVVSAVKKGVFHIYTVKDVDDTLALLSGLAIGKEKNNGQFPNNSINCKIVKQLKYFADKAQGNNDT